MKSVTTTQADEKIVQELPEREPVRGRSREDLETQIAELKKSARREIEDLRTQRRGFLFLFFL